MSHKFPEFVGKHISGHEQAPPDSTPSSSALKLLPVVALIALVLGGIYGGFFTPTEAGAVGALGAGIIALLKRKMGWSKFWQVLIETGHVTASICFLILSASMYSRMLALSGLPNFFGAMMTQAEIGYWGMLILYVIIILAMGTILDSGSIMLIMIPLVLPIIEQYGMEGRPIDLIWFGIVTVIAVEIGLLTPPLGMAAFVIKETLDDQRITLGDIFAGAFPFACIMLIVLIMVIFFPILSTGLI